MRLLIFLLFQVIVLTMTQAQTPRVHHPDFDRTLRKLLSFSVPLMDVEVLQTRLDSVVLLDAREMEEYQTSHLSGARHIGYNHLNLDVLNGVPKDAQIVLYCSVGYRSEKIGEKLRALGYAKVFNLYGGIFEWANRGLPLEGPDGNPTHRLHSYNADWGRWVESEKVQKIYRK